MAEHKDTFEYKEAQVHWEMCYMDPPNDTWNSARHYWYTVYEGNVPAHPVPVSYMVDWSERGFCSCSFSWYVDKQMKCKACKRPVPPLDEVFVPTKTMWCTCEGDTKMTTVTYPSFMHAIPVCEDCMKEKSPYVNTYDSAESHRRRRQMVLGRRPSWDDVPIP